MDLIRLFKLKELNGEFTDLDAYELHLLSLFSKCVKQNNYYLIDGKFYFYYDDSNNIFWYSMERIYLHFSHKYGFKQKNFEKVLRKFLNKYVKHGIRIEHLFMFTNPNYVK